MSNLKGENLWKIYGEVEAIRGVNIEIEEGEIVVIVGPSGSGKTTLLNLLALLDAPTKGKVYLDGKEVTNVGEKEASEIRNKNFGFIFQLFHLIPEVTVIENVYLPLWIREKNNLKINQYREEAKKLLEEFGIIKRANFFPYQLSGGERQKVAICRSLICKPKIIFADEPTGSIDKDSAKIFFEMVEYLNREKGVSFVIVTHNEKFLQLATKAVYLNEGVITEIK